MKSLFLKIFLSYWVAQALFLILAILATLALSERGEYAAWDAQQAAVLNKAVQTYERERRGPVRAVVASVLGDGTIPALDTTDTSVSTS